jgi:signal transduction histidine kinase
MIERLRRVPAWAWDVLMSAGFFAVLVGDLASGSFDGDHGEASVAAGALIALLPLVRRRHPLGAIYAWTMTTCVLSLWLHPEANLVVAFLGLFVFPYNAGRRVPGRRAALAIPPIWVAMAAAAVANDEAIVGDILFPGLFGMLFWLVGRAMANRVRLAAELHEEALRAEEERQAEAARAVADERRRIAREMHDVVAHSVSMMVIQAGGAAAGSRCPSGCRWRARRRRR